MHDTREIVGFFCRWTLLAAAGGMILCGAWAGVLATVAVAADLNARLIAPDSIVSEPDMLCFACITRSVPSGPASLVLFGRGDRTDRVAGSGSRAFSLHVPGVKPGACAIAVTGIPYGALAFEKTSFRLLAVAPGSTLHLVDARLAVRELATDRERFLAFWTELGRHGRTGCFCSGDMIAFERLQQDLRTAAPEIPLYWDYGLKENPMRTLRDISWRIGGMPVVITEDADLASQAAAGRFPTHLIGPAGAALPPTAGALRHESLTSLIQHLAAKRPG